MTVATPASIATSNRQSSGQQSIRESGAASAVPCDCNCLSRVAETDIVRHLLLPLWRHLCRVFRPTSARSKLLALNIVPLECGHWTFDRFFGHVTSWFRTRLIKQNVPMKRAPRVGLEALTIPRGTSALGLRVRISLTAGNGSYHLSPTHRFIPASFYAVAPPGAPYPVGRAARVILPIFTIPVLTSGWIPYPPPNYWSMFSRCDGPSALGSFSPRLVLWFIFCWNLSGPVIEPL
jgi:hypothetical protein